MTTRTEVLFYHLEQMPLEKVLPQLVERTLQRGWRAVVEVGSPARVEVLNTLLWTWRDDSFIPHGAMSDGHAAEQPVYLTAGPENPNGATVRFLVDGAVPATFAGYDRLVIIFDGNDGRALARARETWKAAKAAGTTATYWQQSAEGRWEKKA